MTTIRRTKISFEKHELTLISLPPHAKFFCSTCDAELEHLAVAGDVGSPAVSDANDLRRDKSEPINSSDTGGRKTLDLRAFGKLVWKKS